MGLTWQAFIPALSAAFMVCLTILGAAFKIGSLIREEKLERDHIKADIHELKADIKDVNGRLENIQGVTSTMAQLLTQQSNDGKRLDRLEGKVDHLEARGA